MNKDPNVIAVYKQIVSWVNKDDELDASSIVMLVTRIIALIQLEVTETGKGDCKKKVALQVLNLIIDDSELDSDAKLALKLMVQKTVPAVIDQLIKVANQDIDLGKAAASFKAATSGCFPCL